MVRNIWPDVATAQIAQNTQLTQSYQAAIHADIQFTNAAGVAQTYQADAGSRSNLHDMLDGFSISKTVPTGFYWVAKDNSRVPFTYGDMQALAQAMATRGAALFATLQNLKDQVRAATTVPDVLAVHWVNA